MSAKEVQKVSSDGYINIDGRKYTVKDSETVGEYYFFDDTDYPLYALKRQNSSSYYLICQAQLSDVWKLSDKYMEITVPGDTAYSDNFFEETEFTTVSEAFDNYKADAPIETTTPNSSCTFTFKFNNGKCTSVVNTVTSI